MSILRISPSQGFTLRAYPDQQHRVVDGCGSASPDRWASPAYYAAERMVSTAGHDSAPAGNSRRAAQGYGMVADLTEALTPVTREAGKPTQIWSSMQHL